MTAGLVEPLCRPLGLEVSVALAARGFTGILKSKRAGFGRRVRVAREGVAGEGAGLV